MPPNVFFASVLLKEFDKIYCLSGFGGQKIIQKMKQCSWNEMESVKNTLIHEKQYELDFISKSKKIKLKTH